MIELGADNYKAMSEFHNMKVLAGIKPCIIFNGPAWDLNQDLKRLKSLFTDFFYRDKVGVYTIIIYGTIVIFYTFVCYCVFLYVLQSADV